MVTISVLEFRRQAKSVIRRLRQGQRMILTYRGKAVARMEPILGETVAEDDPIYSLAELATRDLAPCSNEEMERLIYEE
jgi:antitoxin (DNA-binding transcriptional repressor) of toxin-antitoxin stability system